MKQIRIHFCDFGDMQGIANYFIEFLGNHFEVVLDDKTPQYVFYSVFGSSEILKYKDSIRIFYTGENLCADFDLCDYAIDFNHLEFFDRHLRYPLYLFYKEDFLRASKKHQNITPQILQEKTRFCNFVVSNNIFAESFREEAFYALNSYKRVDSGGRFLNNIGGRVKDKFAFQSECKFSLCFENSSTPGYITEKLIQAVAAKTIPIYWGDERACLALSERGGGINKKAIIFVQDLEQMKKEVERLDNDDEAFLAKLREPLFLDKNHSEFFTHKMEGFLLHIFTQDFTKAFRRGKGMRLKKEAEYQIYVRIRNFIKSVCSVRHLGLFKALRARKSTIRKGQ